MGDVINLFPDNPNPLVETFDVHANVSNFTQEEIAALNSLMRRYETKWRFINKKYARGDSVSVLTVHHSNAPSNQNILFCLIKDTKTKPHEYTLQWDRGLGRFNTINFGSIEHILEMHLEQKSPQTLQSLRQQKALPAPKPLMLITNEHN